MSYQIYPFIFTIIGLVIYNNFSKKIIFFLILCHIIYCFLFISIYNRPHSRIQSSNWIYQNIPSESKIANEYWDDPLPLYLNYSNFMISSSVIWIEYSNLESFRAKIVVFVVVVLVIDSDLNDKPKTTNKSIESWKIRKRNRRHSARGESSPLSS